METVEVEITGQAITAQYGTLNTGDILRTSPEFAKHLVDDCSAAKYRNARSTEAAPAETPPAQVALEQPAEKPAKPRKAK